MDDHDRESGRGGWTELTLVIGFLAVLCYPAVSLFRSSTPGRGQENRVLAARPPLTLLLSKPHRFARVFKAYFDDQFEARDRLVLLNSTVRYRVLRFEQPLCHPRQARQSFLRGRAQFSQLRHGKRDGSVPADAPARGGRTRKHR